MSNLFWFLLFFIVIYLIALSIDFFNRFIDDRYYYKNKSFWGFLKMLYKSKNSKLWKKLLRKKLLKVEFDYKNTTDAIKGFIGHKEAKELFFEPSISEPKILYDWKVGNLSSREAYNIMNKTDLEKIAGRKILRPVTKLNDNYINRNYKKVFIEGRINYIKKTIMQDYMGYLLSSKKYLKYLADIEDEYEVCKIVHGKHYHVTNNFKWRELTLNQAIRYIKYEKLISKTDEKYKENDMMIRFTKRSNISNIKNPIYSEWFLGTKQQASIIAGLYNVYTKIDRGREFWIKGLKYLLNDDNKIKKGKSLLK